MLTDVESAILRLTQLIDIFGDLSVNSNYAEVLLDRKDEKAMKTAIEALKARPHGEWISQIYETIEYYQCSVCKMLVRKDNILAVLSWKYCPNCGADMRKKEGEAE